jgi:hypothetical protein
MTTIIRKGIALLFKITLTALLVAVLSPVLYFAWRAAQPMEIPELKGMSYAQFLAVNEMCQDYLLQRYHTHHPDEPPGWNDTKYKMSNIFPEVEMFFFTGYATLHLLLHWDIRNIERNWPWLDASEDVTWLNFFPAWWQIVEQFMMYRFKDGIFVSGTHAPDDCERPLSPDEFHTLKQKLELSTAP